MDTQLQPLSSPVTITDIPLTEGETTIIMHCHDRTFKSVTILTSTGTPLFTITGKGSGSINWQRTIHDSTGTAIFDLRHPNYGMKNLWTVKRPSGRDLCTLKHVDYMGKSRSALEMTVFNESDIGAEVLVKVQPRDASAVTTVVKVGETPVAEIRLVEENDVIDLTEKDRSVWQGRIAGGMDLGVVCLCFSRGRCRLTSALGCRCYALPCGDESRLEAIGVLRDDS
jgi:hypothetical protein